jgi:hypothetical protein
VRILVARPVDRSYCSHLSSAYTLAFEFWNFNSISTYILCSISWMRGFARVCVYIFVCLLNLVISLRSQWILVSTIVGKKILCSISCLETEMGVWNWRVPVFSFYRCVCCLSRILKCQLCSAVKLTVRACFLVVWSFLWRSANLVDLSKWWLYVCDLLETESSFFVYFICLFMAVN